ncbi:hypothetical protein M107_5128 [Bacteroides fragilis str. 3725 D9(v)]|uniref:hypothetical protein n=1 Tax=Bacteroidaceae TaxID=815 RepID=UPI00031A9551|nr:MULTISPECIES: hypothetical protein [Bacteroidaceae]KDS20216.1 hypothetical protein M082_2234 [Bacteroides fragilis str. 3725 D9 ii]EXZ60709.1 hypothetical protein M107_5128 [Bacteroides fragilis str. 3725 D9(v)]MBE7400982.1 hypothetical protein [Bacteroides fragilis]MCA6038588.1 hypothetical protein [Bacteroides thetaiotaomicron]MCE8577148.1 hypothetical protein [Bacteroides fragilis]
MRMGTRATGRNGHRKGENHRITGHRAVGRPKYKTRIEPYPIRIIVSLYNQSMS